MRQFLGLLLICWTAAQAQEVYTEHIREMRLQGTLDAGFPASLVASHPVTVSFDWDAPQPSAFVVRIWHCDRDWHRTESVFLNDPTRNALREQIPYSLSPQGVEHYRYTYTLRLPGTAELERFRYSGNYAIEIWDDREEHRLGSARFFVAESLLEGGVKVWNRLLPSGVAPWNQVNKLIAAYSVPPQEMRERAPIYAQFIRTADVYRNREILRPFRIDADDQNPNTFVDGWGTNELKFIIDNLPPGNEYRTIDLRSSDLYPPGRLHRSRGGADVSRWLKQGTRDHNGIAAQVTTGLYADYLEYQFELLLPEERSHDSVFVVGDFNGWTPTIPWAMWWDSETGRFIARGWLKRGQYDYQYVLNRNDWLSLEGNDWRTTSVYTVIVYYRDQRFGGFDRILVIAQERSPGGSEATAPD